MIALTEKDRPAILEYLSAEPEMNLFFIGDIESYGVDTPPVQIYAHPAAGSWDFLLLQYFDFYIVYTRGQTYDTAALAEFLKERRVDCLSGKLELLEPMTAYFPQRTLEPTYLCRCNAVNQDACRPLPAGTELRRLTEADLDEVTRLLLEVEEFADSYKGEDGPQRCRRGNAENLKNGLLYGLFENGRMVCTAQTSADNSQSAMVVAVATDKSARGRGYASNVVSALCRASFARGKQFLCLFYDNPVAGRIYHRIGFETIGRYAMLK